MATIKIKNGQGVWHEITTIRGPKGNDFALSYTNVNAVTDTYECDLAGESAVNFALSIADTNAKAITFVNLPAGRAEVFLEITTSAEPGAITWTLNGGNVAWSTGSAPIMVTDKVYRILFFTSDGGATWDVFPSVGM